VSVRGSGADDGRSFTRDAKVKWRREGDDDGGDKLRVESRERLRRRLRLASGFAMSRLATAAEELVAAVVDAAEAVDEADGSAHPSSPGRSSRVRTRGLLRRESSSLDRSVRRSWWEGGRGGASRLGGSGESSSIVFPSTGAKRPVRF